MSDDTRHSKASEAELISDPDELARRESLNTVRQFAAVSDMVETFVSPERQPFRFRPSHLLHLHRAALDGISSYAGNFRPASIEIGGSKHQPPPAHVVPEHVEELCDYINDMWKEKSPIHLASYVMWKLNWIHPFTDGNGRTSRAAAYLILCTKLGYVLPGHRTIPDQISEDKTPYYKALEAADQAWRRGQVDLTAMKQLISSMLAEQLKAVHDESGVGEERDELTKKDYTVMPQQLLFSEFDIFRVMEAQKDALKKAIASAPESLTAANDEENIRAFVNQFDIEVPELQEAAMTMSEREVEVDVSYDQRRFFSRQGPFYVKGTEIVVHIPFTGESVLFRVQPSTFTLSPPRGEVVGQDLLISFQFPNDMPPPNLKAELDRNVRDIQTYLQNLRSSQGVLRLSLESEARGAWNRRKAEFANRTQTLGGLGFPRRELHTQASPQLTAKHPISKGQPVANKQKDRLGQPSHRWHVFISHASEDKEAIAKPLADALIKAGLSVWYDDYTLTVGDSLRRKIDEGLSKSEFGIVILSKAFFSKDWPQQELNGLAAKEINSRKVILPVWHDISKNEVAQVSPMLADRLGAPTSIGLENVVSKLVEAMNRQE